MCGFVKTKQHLANMATSYNFISTVEYALQLKAMHMRNCQTDIIEIKQHRTRMWANAQPDGRPAEYRWRPLFNAAKFG